MKVTVFGIGRSGTKAVQLYIAYYLAKHYKKVRIVYEPFLMHSRLKGSENSFALRIHNSTPFVNANNSANLKRFINSINYNDNTATIYKFIRGNGRIDPINDILKPNFSILIIRDLYEVLASIAVQTWNMENKWDKLENELIKFYPEAKYLSDPNKLTRHAAYWYCMNRYALENSNSINYFINFKDVEILQKILNENQIDADLGITEELFTGENIHNSYPLKDITQIKENSIDKIKMILGSSFGQIGTISEINEDEEQIKSEKGPRVMVERNQLFDRFNQEIFELLSNKN